MMAKDNGPEWELSKENAAPLERGRNIEVLSRALAPSSNFASKLHEQEGDKNLILFESLIHPSENFSQMYARRIQEQNVNDKGMDPKDVIKEILELVKMDKDPLIHWLRYIKYHEETYPSDTNSQFVLMERCTRALLHYPLYANDHRFVRVCIIYADKASDPNGIFKFYHQNKIGNTIAIFWMAWAWVAEKNKDFAFAEKIFLKALTKKAKPAKVLDNRYKQFQRRMSRHWLNAASDEIEETLGGDELADQENERRALCGLTEQGVRQNHRSRNMNGTAFVNDHSNRNAQQGINNGRRNHGISSVSNQTNSLSRTSGEAKSGGFNIFVEDDQQGNDEYDLSPDMVGQDDPHFHKQLMMPREVERKKENVAKAERWNERGGLHSQRHNDIQPDEQNLGGVSVSDMSGVHRWTRRGNGRSSTSEVAAQPAFQVFVDEECSTKNEEKVEKNITKRSTRSLRQQLDEGVIDTNPLHCVRNPLKVSTSRVKRNELMKGVVPRDQILKKSIVSSHVGEENFGARKKNSSDPGTKHNTDKDLWGFDKRLVAKGSDGQEECFEQHRVYSKYYTLGTCDDNFNNMECGHDNDENDNSCINVEDTSSVADDTTKSKDHSNRNANKFYSGGVCDIRLNTNVEVNSPPHFTDSFEEKIPMPRKVLFGANTTIGSMNNEYHLNNSVESSIVDGPDAVGVITEKEETINTRFAAKELSMMFSSPIVDCKNNNSDNKSIIGSAVNCNNSSSSLKPLFSVHCKKKQDNNYYSGNSQPPNEKEKEILVSPKFDVQSKSDNTKNYVKSSLQQGNKANKKDVDGAMYSSEEEVESSKFEIFCDNDFSEDDNELCQSQKESKIFSIFHDPTVELNSSTSENCCDNNNDTASLADIEKLLSSPNDSNVRSSAPLINNKCNNTMVSNGFSICCDDEHLSAPLNNNNCNNKMKSNGFSIFCDDEGSSAPLINNNCNSKTESNGFSIYCDDNDNGNVSKSGNNENVTVLTENAPAFGNISLIETCDDKLSSISPKITKLGYLEEINYDDYHNDKTNVALDELMVNENSSQVFDQRSRNIPVQLVKKVNQGTEIEMDDLQLTLKHELGRGAYGTVLLCHSSTNKSLRTEQDIALKIQSPLGCLAWEYKILCILEERIRSSTVANQNSIRRPIRHSTKRYKEDNEIKLIPFPRALSFVAFSDGGTLGMTAGSDSGLTLIDVINLYDGKVPELIAIHYTSRMLLHLNSLHLNGKILHCDVKADNWVLTTSNSKYKTNTGKDLPGSDLMLVDFGRSVDLVSLKHTNKDNRDVRLCGKFAAKDMQCVAMKEERSWSTEIDTYGLCASSHVLLFGVHMNIQKERSSSRWRLQKTLRRYWQRDLWQNLFDSLLNDESGVSLPAIREPFDKYLADKDHQKELISLLRHQTRLLPNIK